MDVSDFTDFTVAEYAQEVSRKWGPGQEPPPLGTQIDALPQDIVPGRFRGDVCWGWTSAGLRLTERIVRLAPGGFMVRRNTLEVIQMVVPVERRRQGFATEFLKELATQARIRGRVVMVESVLSEPLHRILVRQGYVCQQYGWEPSAEFEVGMNYVLPA